MSRDDKIALGVLLILGLSLPLLLLHRWGRREPVYSAVGAKPLESPRSILVKPLPGIEDPRGRRVGSFGPIAPAPPEGGAAPPVAPPAETSSPSVGELPGSPEDGGFGAPAAGAPRPALGAAPSLSGLAGGGAEGGADESEQAPAAGKGARPAAGQRTLAPGKGKGEGRGSVSGARAEGGKAAGTLGKDSQGQLSWKSQDLEAPVFGGPASAGNSPSKGAGLKGAPDAAAAQVQSMMEALRNGSKLAAKQMAQIREIRAKEDKQFEKIMDYAVKNPPKPPPPETGATMARGRFWPVDGRISQNFGGVSWAAYGPQTWNGVRYPHFHNGLDIAAPLGTPIKAYDGGQVNFVGMSNGYGMNVVLSHPGGVSSRYGHMLAGKNAPPVKDGQYVNAGQTIGFIGMTGFTTGPHLHFIVRDSKDYLNPAAVLPQRK